MRLKSDFGAHQSSDPCHPASKAKEIRLLAEFHIAIFNFNPHYPSRCRIEQYDLPHFSIELEGGVL